MVLGMGAGAFICDFAELSSFADYEYGLQVDFSPFDVTYALIKTCVFALIITSVSAYHGLASTSGGAREVGRSSTKAVVYSVVIVMVANLVITQLLLT